MKLTFLGTGTSQGIPVIACNCEVCLSSDPRDTRLRTSVLISVNGKNIVIDVGPDFRQQMLLNKVVDIDSVLLTHEHTDHIIGLDDLRPFNFRHRKDIPIYATKHVGDCLKKRFDYAFSKNPYPGVPRFDLREISADHPFEVADQNIIPFEVLHGKMPVLGFRFGDLTYITDAKTINEQAIEKIKGTQILIINALRFESHHSHFNMEEALEFIQLIQPRQAYLTHISHMLGLNSVISDTLPSNIFLAYDGQTLEIT